MDGTWVKIMDSDGYGDVSKANRLYPEGSSSTWRVVVVWGDSGDAATLAGTFASQADASAAIADLVNGRDLTDLD